MIKLHQENGRTGQVPGRRHRSGKRQKEPKRAKSSITEHQSIMPKTGENKNEAEQHTLLKTRR